ncbi:MAG: hypothetical protein ABW061_10725, partial [Polyangiaceae bacterium]
LVELMAVVTITAILATAGITMFRRHIVASRGAEAVSFLQGMRAAEATYMSENHIYLNVSTSGNGAAWYPAADPKNQRSRWMNSQHDDWKNWQKLGLPLDKTVAFSYLANAGGPGVAIPTLQVTNGPVFAVPQVDWYVLQAKGDTDGNGVYALYATTSLTGELYSENDSE